MKTSSIESEKNLLSFFITQNARVHLITQLTPEQVVLLRRELGILITYKIRKTEICFATFEKLIGALHVKNLKKTL